MPKYFVHRFNHLKNQTENLLVLNFFLAALKNSVK